MKILKLELKLNIVEKKNEFTISGSDLLSEITYLLVRKRHEFHGSKSEK